MDERALLPDILRSRAELDPARRAYVWLDERGEEEAELTYGGLHARALAVAAELASRCERGDRALLLFPPCLDFIVAYFGCLYAQVVAVPVNPPRKATVQGATRSVVRNCVPSAVLTLASMVDYARASLESVCGPLHWLAVDELDDEASFEPLPCSPDSIAFLQYTSGSTSDPKGVMVTHGNLAADEEMIRDAFDNDGDSSVVGWAPFFHDQGLIGNVLHALYLGTSAVLMSPLVFGRWPLRWLEAISRYRAHSSGGPNFAFDICAARAAGGRNVPADLDLSSWKVAFNGAEPLRADTLRRFAEAFAPYGFSAKFLCPCYGLAEATLLVTGTKKGQGPRTVEADLDGLARRRFVPAAPGRARTLVGSGRILPQEDVRIVDPDTGRPCAPDAIGEIWVSGPHVAKGYWRTPETTAEVFGARLEDAPGRTYLRTGDLGVVVDDELYVVGRIKDVIIIRGRNFYPHDIELTAQSSHPALRKGGCAAFTAAERLVIVQEVKADQDADPADIRAAIREAIVREHDLTLNDLVLVQARELDKTSSGKIMRAAARKRYLERGLAAWRPGDAIAGMTRA